MATPPEAVDLEREIGRLTHRLRGVGPAWFAAHASPETGPVATRAAVLHALVVTLAELGARAGNGAPTGSRAPKLAPHALADQLAVVTNDLLGAPERAAVLGPAVTAVQEARSRVESVGVAGRAG